MFRKIALVILTALVVFSTTAWWDPPRFCLRPGSYIFGIEESSILRLKLDGANTVEIKRLPINIPGSAPSGTIALTACDLYFAWSRTGRLPDIVHMNPSTGWEQNRITRTIDKAEMDPAIELGGGHLAFTEISGISSVVSMNLRTGWTKIEAVNAMAPASGRIFTWTDMTSGMIYIWGAPGQRHQYLPDRSGLLVQNGQNFYIWPVVGVKQDFGIYRSVALRPSGSLAAVITLDGKLEFIKLDRNWLPYGDPVPGPDIGSVRSITWIEVP